MHLEPRRRGDGAAVPALAVLGVGLGGLTAATALLAGAGLWRAALLGVLVPWAVLTAATALLGFFLLTADEPIDPYPGDPTDQRPAVDRGLDTWWRR